MFLRAATDADTILIADLADQIWHDHYIPIIGETQVNYMLNKLYSREGLIKQMNEGQQFFIIQDQDIAIGFAAVTAKPDDELFLNKLYISTNQQSKGIGAAIFKQLLALFPDKVLVRLTVNRQNYKSINFYFKLGFKIEQVADFDIGNGYYMNDFVMVNRIEKSSSE